MKLIADLMDSPSAASKKIAAASPPCALISSAAFLAPSSLKSARTTLAPSFANNFAEASPIPEALPVNNATF